jgi:hypothetical protein
MRLNQLISGTLLLLLLIVAACKKKNEAPDMYYAYFPVDEGRYVTYSVMEVHIDSLLHLNDTSMYYVKAVMGDTITDNEGRVARRYNRYYRDNPNDPWVLHDIWTAIITNGRAELVEENQRTIKMVFAPTKYKEWNCNAFNMLDPLDCYYRDLHVEGGINGFYFDSTMTVEQEDYRTNVDFRRKYEQYAKGVGLYYKHYKDYKIYFDTADIIKGNEIIMKLIDYGVE